jgi:hypothetical protein
MQQGNPEISAPKGQFHAQASFQNDFATAARRLSRKKEAHAKTQRKEDAKRAQAGSVRVSSAAVSARDARQKDRRFTRKAAICAGFTPSFLCVFARKIFFDGVRTRVSSRPS